MNVQRGSAASSLIDVLDRVLDKGIVIDAWVRVSLVGIDLITVEARVIVASFETYFKYADAFGVTERPSMRTVVVHGNAQVEVDHRVPPAVVRQTRRHKRVR
jgi:gas vesicle structural protein